MACELCRLAARSEADAPQLGRHIDYSWVGLAWLWASDATFSCRKRIIGGASAWRGRELAMGRVLYTALDVINGAIRSDWEAAHTYGRAGGPWAEPPRGRASLQGITTDHGRGRVTRGAVIPGVGSAPSIGSHDVRGGNRGCAPRHRCMWHVRGFSQKPKQSDSPHSRFINETVRIQN